MLIFSLMLIGVLVTATMASIVFMWIILLAMVLIFICSVSSLIFLTNFELIFAVILTLVVVVVLIKQKALLNDHKNNTEK
jgi:hypothetical protein